MSRISITYGIRGKTGLGILRMNTLCDIDLISSVSLGSDVRDLEIRCIKHQIVGPVIEAQLLLMLLFTFLGLWLNSATIHH